MSLAAVLGPRSRTSRRPRSSRVAAMGHRLMLVLVLPRPSPSLLPTLLLVGAVTSVTVGAVEGAVDAHAATTRWQCPPRSSSLLGLTTPWPSPPSTPRTGGRPAAAAVCIWTARARIFLTRRMGDTMPSTSTVLPHLAASLRTPGQADPRDERQQDVEEGGATGKKLPRRGRGGGDR